MRQPLVEEEPLTLVGDGGRFVHASGASQMGN